MSANVSNKSALKSATAGKGHNQPPVDIAKVIDDAMALHGATGKVTASLILFFWSNEVTYSLTKINQTLALKGKERTAGFNAILASNSPHAAKFIDDLATETVKYNEANKHKRLSVALQSSYKINELEGKLKSARNMCTTALLAVQYLRKTAHTRIELASGNRILAVDSTGVATQHSSNALLALALAKPKAKKESTESTGDTAKSAAEAPLNADGTPAAPAPEKRMGVVQSAIHNAVTAVETLSAASPVKPDATIMGELDTLVAKLLAFYGAKDFEAKVNALKARVMKAQRDAANAKAAEAAKAEAKKA